MNARQGDQPHEGGAGFPGDSGGAAGRPMMRPEPRPEMLPPGAGGSGGSGGPGGSAGPGGPGGPPGYGPRPGMAMPVGPGPVGAAVEYGSADQAFAPPPGAHWTPVSPRLAWHRRISVLLGGLLTAAAGGAAVWWTGG